MQGSISVTDVPLATSHAEDATIASHCDTKTKEERG